MSDEISGGRRIAMWSGPRNISTAMMRAWGSRTDTAVCDEPLYAHYLQQTGFQHHPGYDEVISSQATDYRQVVEVLIGPIPGEKTIFYQKQMAHHLLPHIPLDWTESLTNVFLIRNPKEMLLSLVEFIPNPTADETGLPQQAKLFQHVQARTGDPPVVLDAKDVLMNPAEMLEQLCARVDVPFDPGMLQWEPGIRETDGIWAKYWYQNVAKSTGFDSYRPRTGTLPDRLLPVLENCQAVYETLAACKLTVP